MGRRPRDEFAEVGDAARDAIARACAAQLPGRSYRVLLAVLHSTATWSRLGDHVSHSELAKLSGVTDLRNLRRELKTLADAGVIEYRPGTSPAGGRRVASWVGLPPDRPRVDTDPGSAPTPGQVDRGSNPAQTGGQIQHRPGVDPDPPSEKYPRKTPKRAREATTNGHRRRRKPAPCPRCKQMTGDRHTQESCDQVAALIAGPS